MYKLIKVLLLCSFPLVAIGWLSSNGSSHNGLLDQSKVPTYKSEDYVGSDACKDCHEDQFKAFSHTSHAQLVKISSWNNKVTG